MAGKAFLIHNLRGSLAELENLGGVASGLHMLLTGPVAAFAGNAFALVHQRKFPMWVLGKLFDSFRVAGLTHLRTYMLVRVRRALLMPAGLLLSVPRGVHPHDSRNPGQQ
jgi:hypothetical protein